jgi:hypothetical protein
LVDVGSGAQVEVPCGASGAVELDAGTTGCVSSARTKGNGAIEMMLGLACVLLTVGVIVYVFAPAQELEAATEKTRLAFLCERKETVYENLRDLNFEYKAGKFPEADYQGMRNALEEEAATVLAEIERLEKGART